jgi:hypothetical protein
LRRRRCNDHPSHDGSHCGADGHRGTFIHDDRRACTDSTTAAATTTGAPVLTPEQVIADNMIPLPPNTELVSVEEMEGGLVVGANVDSPPPPGYATLLTDAGWEVLDVRFGSEATIAVQLELCLIAFANYESSTAPGYWFLFWVVTGVTREDCVSLGDTIIAALAGMGPPLG